MLSKRGFSMKNNKTLILAINPGSTSTKGAVYNQETLLCEQTVHHSTEELKKFDTVFQQEAFRTECMLQMLKENQIDPASLSAVVGRGGITHPVRSGTYRVNQAMLCDLHKPQAATHSSCLGGIIAHRLGERYQIPSFVVDPVVVDERDEVAFFSGLNGIERKSIFHALNSKAMARRAADTLGKKYSELSLIVVHMGGGITISAHRNGKVVDVNDGVNGEGPFSPERSGSLPLRPIIDMCYSGQYSKEEMVRKISGSGGMVSYLQSNDFKEVNQKIEQGDLKAEKVVNAMGYQIAKEIGAMAVVLQGKVDAIVLTGGLAYSERFVSLLKQRVSFLSKILVYPGEDEMLALCQGALRVLSGEEQPKDYV